MGCKLIDALLGSAKSTVEGIAQGVLNTTISTLGLESLSSSNLSEHFTKTEKDKLGGLSSLSGNTPIIGDGSTVNIYDIVNSTPVNTLFPFQTFGGIIKLTSGHPTGSIDIYKDGGVEASYLSDTSDAECIIPKNAVGYFYKLASDIYKVVYECPNSDSLSLQIQGGVYPNTTTITGVQALYDGMGVKARDDIPYDVKVAVSNITSNAGMCVYLGHNVWYTLDLGNNAGVTPINQAWKIMPLKADLPTQSAGYGLNIFTTETAIEKIDRATKIKTYSASAGTLKLDFIRDFNIYLDLTGNIAVISDYLGDLSGNTLSQGGTIEFKQDATGGRTVSWSSSFIAGTFPNEDVSPNKTNLYGYQIINGKIVVNHVKAY